MGAVAGSTQTRAVSIGGGTGQPNAIRALRGAGCSVSAIVAMADDGGSTGLLREKMGLNPPGDIRKCLVAMADVYKRQAQYRRFRVRGDFGEANDFLSMQEVLGRRYAPERMADERFGLRPDLLIVDGGKPQLTAAVNQLSELGLDIPVAGLAKSDEELFVPWSRCV